MSFEAPGGAMVASVKVIEPATEKVLAEVPEAGVDDADHAVARAKAAFPAWGAVTPGDRAKLLRRFAQAVAGSTEKLAQLEARNVGKPISDARGEGGRERCAREDGGAHGRAEDHRAGYDRRKEDQP